MCAAARRPKKKLGSENSKAKPKRTSQKFKQRSENELWVDTEFFRGLTQRSPQIVIPHSPPVQKDYYLELASIILGPGERRRTDRNAIAFSKTPEEPKKPKAG